MGEEVGNIGGDLVEGSPASLLIFQLYREEKHAGRDKYGKWRIFIRKNRKK